ncbi:hypothetical protein EW145_g1373 [Phellinidium pouzarii]|uniref:Uncharacterized protein n=1 Tax=Phellinidium pouzarii TaxID=167371 RepID=A0A4S4LF17_9AGAM|nr:hypothetical protein EW145_g1373 [Phellinidium pouzarii]
MFRASPWISYAPDGARPPIDDQHSPSSANHTITADTDHHPTNTDMHSDEYVDMDAPQISTLKDDNSPPPVPPPAPPRLSKFRVRLKVSEPSSNTRASPSAHADSTAASGLMGSSRRSVVESEDDDGDEDEEDEEEDQLADDDDIPSVAPSSVVGTPQRPATTRGRGGGRGRGRGRGRGGSAVSATEPPQTVFELSPNAAQDRHSTQGVLEPGSTLSTPKPARKRARKSEGERKKPGRKPKASKALAQIQDDAVSVSESFVGTAASSPFPREMETPEIEPLALDSVAGAPPCIDRPRPSRRTSLPSRSLHTAPSIPSTLQTIPRTASPESRRRLRPHFPPRSHAPAAAPLAHRPTRRARYRRRPMARAHMGRRQGERLRV